MENTSSSSFHERPLAWMLFLAAALGFLGGIGGATLTLKTKEIISSPPISEGTRENRQVAASSEAERNIVHVVKQVSPAVVAVVVSENVPTVRRVPFDPFGGSLFGSPFQLRLENPNGQTQQQDVGGGSAFVVDPDGLLLTNKHVVSSKTATYSVVFSSGERVPASVVARDPVLDLALLKVDKQNLPTLSFGDSDALNVGQTVMAIGNALAELPNSVSVGVVSGIGRRVQAGDRTTGEVEELDAVIQTDAAINPGNSGGPLVDASGKVIGINTAVASAENIGFALPVRGAKRVVEDYKAHGRVIRAILGVRYILITPANQNDLQVSVSDGALVVAGSTVNEPAVVPGSGAAKAGLAEGDIITEVDGVKVTTQTSLQSFIRDKHPGDTIMLTVLSKGNTKNVSVVLTDANTNSGSSS